MINFSCNRVMMMPEYEHGNGWGRMFRCRNLLMILAVFGLTACVPPQYAEIPVAEDQPPPPPSRVYFYPTRDQTPAQQDRDSYECYLWAKQQTGYDPSAPHLAPHARVAVVPEPPPGTGTAVGAVTGALLGAAVSSHGNRPEGALVGALAGGMLGTVADVARQEEAARLQEHYDRQGSQRLAVIERQASEYRRALTACLEGRGYTVR
jgi:hypothetical protein